jgi:hypothetical protein
MLETWELDLAGWHARSAATPPRPALQSLPFSVRTLGGVYDVARGRTVVVAGAGVHEYDGVAWSSAMFGPPGRFPHSATVFDPVRARTLSLAAETTMQNGAEVTTTSTWEHDGVRWERRTLATVPPPRTFATAIHHPGLRGVLLFGGLTATPPLALLQDTWLCDGTGWRRIVTASAPPGRTQATLVHDSARDRTMLLSSGMPAWEFDGVDWRQMAPAHTPPVSGFFAAVYAPSLDRTVLAQPFGSEVITALHDGHGWSLPVTSPHRVTSIAYDPVRGRVLALGDDLLEYDGVRWTTAAPRPSLVVGLTAHDSVRHRTLASDARGRHWLLAPATQPSFTRHGTGCAGSGGAASLDAAAGAVPALGTTMALQLGSLAPTPGVCVLALGFDLAQWNGAPLPIELAGAGLPGCRLWIAPVPGAAWFAAHGGGSALFALPIPASPWLAGVVFGAQAIAIDPTAANGVAALSNAVVLRVQ